MSGYADLSRAAYISPNDLMASTRVNYYPQELQLHNQLLEQNTQANQQGLDATSTEYFARAAQGLVALGDEAKAAAAYPDAVASLPPSLRGRAPAQFPGMTALQRVAALGTPSEKLAERQGVATDAAGVNLGSRGAGGGAGTAGGDASGQARLLPGETEDQFLARIEQRESGGRNVMNFRNKENPSYYTAGGYYQIVDSTWKAGAQAAGIDISQYPTAISAPREVQTQVARSILRNFGPQHWNESEPAAGGDRSRALAGRVAPTAPASGPGTQVAAPERVPYPRPVTTVEPETGLPVLARPAPTAPAGGGGTVAPYQVATVGSTPPPPTSGGTAAASALPPSQVAAPQARATGQPVEIPGGNGSWALPNGTITSQPPAATTQQPPPPPPPRPAEMPAELRTNEAYLTPRDVDEFDSRRKNLRGKEQYQQWLNDIEQRKAANERRQKDWQAQEHQRQTDAIAAVKRQEEQEDRLRKIEEDRQTALRTGRKEEADVLAAQAVASKTKFDQANTLRDEATKITETFRPMQEANERIAEAAKAQNSLGDLALIYTYTRLLDPATVHEEEVKRGMKAGGLGEYVSGWYDRVTKGEALTPAVRQQFAEMGRKFYDVRKKAYEQELGKYRNLAEKFGLDPDTVAVSLVRDQGKAVSKPPPGLTVVIP